MEQKNNDEYIQETMYLNETLEIIQKQIESSKEKMISTRKNFNAKADDPIVMENLLKMYDTGAKNLEKSLNSPYFARIDFKAKDEIVPSNIYIGKCSVMNDDYSMRVVDWRTPVASLYYDGRLGNVSYIIPDTKEEISGYLSLKRIYEIQKGQLQHFSNVDLATNDELLKPYLSAESDTRLKNIISTIQTEQNKIIRAELKKPLIVQGVAGSGKTTVALHRIAYLAYTYEKQLKPQDFLIIAPNKFFLDYISMTLPDLGVDDVSQLTFEDFARKIIGKGIKIESSNNKLADIVNNGKNVNDIVQLTSSFKSSLQYKKLLDLYLDETGLGFLPNEDLKVGDITIFSKEKLREGFNEQFYRSEISMESRFKTYLLRLKMLIENNQEFLEQSIRKKRQLEILQIDENLSEKQKQDKKIEIFNKYDSYFKKLENGGKKLLAEYSKKAGKKNALEIYKGFVEQLGEETNGTVPEEIILQIQHQLLQNPRSKEVEYEDLAPLIYIQYKLKGADIVKNSKYIVIDEAQDYSEFQFAVLRYILQNKNMTILGDIAQGIYSYRGVTDWDKINNEIFDNEAEILELKKSYRTTIEIMEKGNDVIDKARDKININLGQPVIRNGEPVTISKQTSKELIATIVNRLNELLNNNRNNIAVISKTLEEATKLHKSLTKSGIQCYLISDKATEYKGGISIMPSYLSKGLEFDSVILSNVNKENYSNNELDAKLLYVAITRAMHTLDIYYIGEESELLMQRNKEIEKDIGE